MNVYVILILAFDVLIMIGTIVHGVHKGFAKLLSKVISLIISIIVVTQLSGIVLNYRSGNASSVLTGILMLVVMGILYKIIHVILTSLRIISRLPVLSGADKVLGAILGFCEGFAILYISEYICRAYLLR